MKIAVTPTEKRLLKHVGIEVHEEADYSVDQALDLLSSVYTAEASFSLNSDKSNYLQEQAEKFAKIADKIFDVLPT